MNEKRKTDFILTWNQITKDNLLSFDSLFDELRELYLRAFQDVDELVWKARHLDEYTRMLKSGQTVVGHLTEENKERWQRKVTQIKEYLPQSGLVQGYNVATMRDESGILCGFASFVIAPVRCIFDCELSQNIGSILQLMLDEKISNFLGDEAYVDLLAVEAKHQRKGLGKQLIFSVFNKYPEIKKLYVVTLTDQANEKAQKFYEHIGFERKETFLDKWGNFRSVYLYSQP